MRRIVRYKSAIHYSDVSSKISPAWHQWLRHTRRDAPSLTEQSEDIRRLANLKVLAAKADERWESKQGLLDKPRKPALESGLAVQSPEHNNTHASLAYGGVVGEGRTNTPPYVSRQDGQSSKGENDLDTNEDNISNEGLNPWKRPGKGPSEDWHPKTWQPSDIQPRKK
jgi:NADH dehydrogenase [ubiquinone] 1 alpha subcomplex assembly factor 2